MDDLLLVLVLVACALGVIGFWLQRRLRLQSVWRRSAAELGLELHGGFAIGFWLEGSVDGFRLRADMRHVWNSTLKVRLEGGERIPHDVTLRAEGTAPGVAVLLGNDDRVDGGFDYRVRVEGNTDTALALLTTPVRSQATSLFTRWPGLKVQFGEIHLWLDPFVASQERLTVTIQELVAFAKALCLDEAAIPARLASNAMRDPDPDVRRRNLEHLLSDRTRSELGRDTALAALADPNANVRITAARGLGLPELDLLLERATSDPEAAVRAALLSHLARFAGARLWPSIEAALGSEHRDVERAAIAAARATRHTALAGELVRRLGSADATTAALIAETLGTIGGPASEAALVDLLSHGSAPIRRAAAAALGRMGGVRAVEPLLALTRGVFAERDVKAAAAGAIGAIQARLGDTEAGALSLLNPDDRAGAVSIATDTAEQGALSVADDEASEVPGRARGGS